MNQIYMLTLVLLLNLIPLNAQTTEVVKGLNKPNIGLAFHGNDLYISELGANKISKIDITASLPTTATDVLTTGLNQPTGLALNGNYLYIAEFGGNKVSKIDITATLPTTTTDVVSGLKNAPTGLLLNGNDLYIAQIDGKKISKAVITETLPLTTITDIVTKLNEPQGMVLNGSDLYFSEESGSKVSKLDLSTLTIDHNINKPSVKIYPNPTNDYILISGTMHANKYEIYSISGNKLVTGNVAENEKIDVHNFKKGVCFIKFIGLNTTKFIKE